MFLCSQKLSRDLSYSESDENFIRKFRGEEISRNTVKCFSVRIHKRSSKSERMKVELLFRNTLNLTCLQAPR